jgi:hypothetical protein
MSVFVARAALSHPEVQALIQVKATTLLIK